VLQCVAMCCIVLQCVADTCRKPIYSVLQCVAVCCSVLQCVAVCCSVLQIPSGSPSTSAARTQFWTSNPLSSLSSCASSFTGCIDEIPLNDTCMAVCCNVLQCVAMCCSVLQCVAMCHYQDGCLVPLGVALRYP